MLFTSRFTTAIVLSVLAASSVVAAPVESKKDGPSKASTQDAPSGKPTPPTKSSVGPHQSSAIASLTKSAPALQHTKAPTSGTQDKEETAVSIDGVTYICAYTPPKQPATPMARRAETEPSRRPTDGKDSTVEPTPRPSGKPKDGGNGDGKPGKGGNQDEHPKKGDDVLMLICHPLNSDDGSWIYKPDPTSSAKSGHPTASSKGHHSSSAHHSKPSGSASSTRGGEGPHSSHASQTKSSDGPTVTNYEEKDSRPYDDNKVQA